MSSEATNPDGVIQPVSKQRTLISRLAELVFWCLFPLALLLVTALASVALGVTDPTIPTLVAFTGLLVFGLCFLVWPNRKLHIGRTRAGVLVALGFVVSAPVAYMASLTPQQRAELQAQAEQRDAAREAARLEAVHAQQQLEERAPPPPTAQEAAAQDPQPPAVAFEAAQASFQQTHTVFMRLADRCDTAWSAMTDAIGTNDPYVSYRAAQRGSEVCRDVSLALGRLEFSNPIERQTRQALNRAVEECSYAMFGRKTAMDQAAQIFDGNMRPSAVEEFRQRAERAQQQTIQCMVQYIGAATEGGYEIPDSGASGD
jgi:hypothetical protein